MEIPYFNFINSGSYLFIIIIIAIIASFFLIWIALFHQDRSVFRPLTKLKNAMEEFSGGNTEIRLQDHTTNREITVLYRTFNHMAEQIINLKIDVYKTSLEKEKIFNQFLRVQIQPHFYTNILNLIYTLASIKDYVTIQELTKNMAEYFRYLLSLKEDLEDELRYRTHSAENKYRILQLRITCNADADEEKIPPLLIQTFIENSIKHNIMLVQDLEISLLIEEEGGMLHIIIKDNGLGFPVEILDRLNDNENIEEDGRHIGIINVKNRMQVLYGGQAAVSIRNEVQGAVVMIRIPRMNKDENTEL
ncbi:MAG: sensor histidine kinase [Eisenbergiella massiliensis]